MIIYMVIAVSFRYGPIDTLRNTSAEGFKPAGFLNKMNLHYQFCPGCGCLLYWTGLGRVGANVRMFEEVHLDKLDLERVDGRHLI